jgi:hypothetical protein
MITVLRVGGKRLSLKHSRLNKSLHVRGHRISLKNVSLLRLQPGPGGPGKRMFRQRSMKTWGLPALTEERLHGVCDRPWWHVECISAVWGKN